MVEGMNVLSEEQVEKLKKSLQNSGAEGITLRDDVKLSKNY